MKKRFFQALWIGGIIACFLPENAQAQSPMEWKTTRHQQMGRRLCKYMDNNTIIETVQFYHEEIQIHHSGAGKPDTTFVMQFVITDTTLYKRGHYAGTVVRERSYTAIKRFVRVHTTTKKTFVGVPEAEYFPAYTIAIEEVADTKTGTAGNLQVQSIMTDTPGMSPRAFRRIYEAPFWQHRRKFVTLGVSLFPSLGYRTLWINDPQFSENKGLQERKQLEESKGMAGMNVSLGYNFSKVSTLAIDFVSIDRGYTSYGNRVNENTGLPTTAGRGAHTVRIQNLGIGLLYSYGGYTRRFNLAADLGGYFMHVPHHADLPEGFRKNNATVRAGIGLSYHPAFPCEIRILPTLYLDFASYNKGSMLRASMLNFGLSAGFTFHYRKDFWHKRL